MPSSFSFGEFGLQLITVEFLEGPTIVSVPRSDSGWLSSKQILTGAIEAADLVARFRMASSPYGQVTDSH